MKNKFEKAIEELKEKFVKIEDVLVVFLYGSVARGDYSLRHSDLDVFMILNRKNISDKIKDKINHFLWPIGSKNGVKIHIEYQGLNIADEDKTLMQKMVEEGKIIYSKSFMMFDNEKIGLKQYIIYSIFAENAKIKTRLSQILHGKKSWYYKGKNKVVKEYAGIIDEKDIIGLGKGCLMVAKEKQVDVVQMFESMGIIYKIKKIVYA